MPTDTKPEFVQKNTPMPIELARWIEETAGRHGVSQTALMREAIGQYRQRLEHPAVPPVQEPVLDYNQFASMMGFCPACREEVRRDMASMGTDHIAVIRRAINQMFLWRPHAEGCPTQGKR